MAMQEIQEIGDFHRNDLFDELSAEATPVVLRGIGENWPLVRSAHTSDRRRAQCPASITCKLLKESPYVHVYIYMYIYTCSSLSLSIYIYIYRERERDMHIYIYICIYMCIYPRGKGALSREAV